MLTKIGLCFPKGCGLGALILERLPRRPVVLSGRRRVNSDRLERRMRSLGRPNSFGFRADSRAEIRTREFGGFRPEELIPRHSLVNQSTGLGHRRPTSIIIQRAVCCSKLLAQYRTKRGHCLIWSPIAPDRNSRCN